MTNNFTALTFAWMLRQVVGIIAAREASIGLLAGGLQKQPFGLSRLFIDASGRGPVPQGGEAAQSARRQTGKYFHDYSDT